MTRQRSHMSDAELHALIEKITGVVIHKPFVPEFITALQSLGWQKIGEGEVVVPKDNITAMRYCSCWNSLIKCDKCGCRCTVCGLEAKHI